MYHMTLQIVYGYIYTTNYVTQNALHLCSKRCICFSLALLSVSTMMSTVCFVPRPIEQSTAQAHRPAIKMY